MNKYLDKAGLQDFATKLTEKYKTLFSSPLTASTVAGMTDHTKVYVYTGSETGYTSGHWYFWNGSAWTDGGVYNAEAINTDTTLSISGAAADAKKAGDEITGLKDDIEVYSSIYSKAEMTSLPGIIYGVIKLEKSAEADCLVYGTHNVAGLIGIPDGTYTLNGITLTINGSEMTFSGTATTGFRFGLLTGTEVTSAELAAQTFPLPVKTYTIITTQTYQNETYLPSISVRKKDNTGDAATTQGNAKEFNGDPTTCGGFYIYFMEGRTYDCGWNFAVFPYSTTVAEPYKLENTNVAKINSNGLYEIEGYTWTSGTPSVTYIASKIPKKPICEYSTRQIPYTGATDVIDVYIPATDGYVDYIFAHTTGASQAAGDGNVWRLVQIWKVNKGFERTKYLTTLGETEMALQIQDRPDYIGGYTHGDEWLVDGSFMCLLDGENVNVSTLTTKTEFTTLQFFSRTNLYDPSSHTTKVGEHGVEWIFTEDGLTINQVIDFTADLTLKGCYVPMLCAIRNNVQGQTLQITDTYIDDGDLTQYDISDDGFTNYPYTTKPGINTLYLIGKDEGVEMSVDFIRQPDSLTNHGVYIYNGSAYNKMYNAICCGKNVGTQNVVPGDRWKTSHHITIKA